MPTGMALRRAAGSHVRWRPSDPFPAPQRSTRVLVRYRGTTSKSTAIKLTGKVSSLKTHSKRPFRVTGLSREAPLQFTLHPVMSPQADLLRWRPSEP